MDSGVGSGVLTIVAQTDFAPGRSGRIVICGLQMMTCRGNSKSMVESFARCQSAKVVLNAIAHARYHYKLPSPKAVAGAADHRRADSASDRPSHSDARRTPSSGVSVEPAKPSLPG